MVEVYGFWGKIVEVRGENALFEFSHPSEPKNQQMWVRTSDVNGFVPRRSVTTPILFTGGGIIACHSCGNAHGECECLSH